MFSVRVLKKLWEWAKERQTTDELKQTLFLAKHLMGRTTWNDAAETNNTKLLDVLWEWGKEEPTTEELSKKLLLAKDDKLKKKASQEVRMMGNTESLEKLRKWAKVNLTVEELKINSF